MEIVYFKYLIPYLQDFLIAFSMMLACISSYLGPAILLFVFSKELVLVYPDFLVSLQLTKTRILHF